MANKLRLKVWVAVIAAGIACCSAAHADQLPFSEKFWGLSGSIAEFVEHHGRQSVLLHGGVAVARDVEFENGSIEFDVMFSEQRGFSGAFWRQQDERNFEQFYLRPHQSGSPDASQYQPVFNGVTAWQLYYGEGYSAPVKHRYNAWTHIRIDFAGQRANIYVDSDVPVLYVDDLKRLAAAGRVGVTASSFAPAYFSNFVATPATENFEIEASAAQQVKADINIIQTWSVSSVFDGELLEGADSLGDQIKSGLVWRSLDAESSGITNLARLNGVGENRDTAFARIDLMSDRPALARLRFGYSDIARVFVNDQLLYSGSNFYESRDYRYLGTIGLFDELVLPLKSGPNEVLIAVSEQFGGWGVMASLEAGDGIRIVQPQSD